MRGWRVGTDGAGSSMQLHMRFRAARNDAREGFECNLGKPVQRQLVHLVEPLVHRAGERTLDRQAAADRRAHHAADGADGADLAQRDQRAEIALAAGDRRRSYDRAGTSTSWLPTMRRTPGAGAPSRRGGAGSRARAVRIGGDSRSLSGCPSSSAARKTGPVFELNRPRAPHTLVTVAARSCRRCRRACRPDRVRAAARGAAPRPESAAPAGC